MGADVVFNSHHCDLYEEIMKLTDGIGVDAAIDITGAGEAIRTALRSVRAADGWWRGPAHQAGGAGPGQRPHLPGGGVHRHLRPEDLGDLGGFRQVMNGPYYHLDTVMGRRFPLEDYEEGLCLYGAGRARQGAALSLSVAPEQYNRRPAFLPPGPETFEEEYHAVRKGILAELVPGICWICGFWNRKW